MKIVIPMAGEGARFKNAGYLLPKPLIPVDGKPMIEWVFDLFPGEEDVVCVCRKEHLEKTNMEEVIMKKKPKAKIAVVETIVPGPVPAALAASRYIEDEEPVIVNYCDFFMKWDYGDFCHKMTEEGFDGCVPVYTGFHPHLLREKNLYASVRVGAQGLLREIREKHSFEEDKMKSMHSPGTYYFRKGAYVKKYFEECVRQDRGFGGEYYVSLVYNLLVEDGLRVGVYDKISHFLQWGTPEDLREYEFWTRIVCNFLEQNKKKREVPENCPADIKDRPSPLSKSEMDQIFCYWENYLKMAKHKT